MSDYNNILAQIGGALSAQATGGSQGLQAYMAQLAGQQSQALERQSRSFEAQMARMAKRQSEAASRAFAREQQTRDQAFQTERDRLNREHDLEMQEARLKERDLDKSTEYEYTAGAIYNAAMSDPEYRQGIQEQMYRTIPGLTLPNGDRTTINWENRDQTVQWLMAGAAGGFTVQQAQEVGRNRTAVVDFYESAYGDGSLAPTGPSTEAKYQDAKRLFKNAGDKLTNLDTRFDDLNQRADRLEKQSSDLSLSEYREGALALAEEHRKLSTQLNDIRKDATLGPFLARGAGLHNASNALGTKAFTVGDRIARDQETKGVAEAAAWSPSDPGSHPMFQDGFGAPTENDDGSDEVNHLMKQKVFKEQQNPAWRAQADFFAGLSPDDLQYLTPAKRSLFRTLQQERSAYGENRVFDLEALLRERRAATMANDNDRIAVVDSIIKEVHESDPTSMSRAIMSGRGSKQAREDVRRFGRTLDVNNSLGFALFQSDEEINAALANHGRLNDLGFPEMPQDNNAFLADYIASEVGMSRLTDGLMGNLMGEGYIPADVAFDQALERGIYSLKKLGLDTGTNKDRLRAQLQARTGQSATIEAPGGAPQQIANYDFSVERLNLTNVNDYGDILPESDLREWEVGYAQKFFPILNKFTAASSAAADFISKFEQGRAAFKQDYAFFWDKPEFKGTEKRLRLQAEVAGESSNVASFYDAFDAFREYVPVFAQLAAKPGRVISHVIAPGEYTEYRQDTFGVSRGKRKPNYAGWVRDLEAPELLISADSFAAQYENNTAADQRDDNTLNMLGFLDLMRAVDLNKTLADVDPEQRKIMLGLQKSLRDMDLKGALAAFDGPSPTGLSFEELGLAMVTPETEAALAAGQDQRTLAERALDPEVELRSIEQAELDLSMIGEGDYIDIDPNPDRDDFKVADEAVIAQFGARLERAKTRAAIVADARRFPMMRDASKSLADVIVSGNIDSPQDIQNLMAVALPAITGMAENAMELEVTGPQALTDRIGKALSARDAISRTLDVIKFSQFQQLSNRAINLSSTVPMATRSMVIEEKRLQLGQIQRQVGVVASEITKRIDPETGKFDVELVPAAMRPYLEQTNFYSLAKKNVDADTAMYMAMQMWAAQTLLAEN